MSRTKTADRLESAVTVRDLIAELEGMDPDARVVMKTESGDYWRTVLAVPVTGAEPLNGVESFVSWTEYHRELALRERKEDDDGSDDDEGDLVSSGVVILS